jgi:outer membrane receptor protein involved in Fe transport
MRTSWLDNRLTANAVAYYIDWSDIQLRTWDTESLTLKIQNAGKADIFGLETEIRYQATDNFQLSVNYGYTDASLAEDFLNARTAPPTVTAVEGTRLPGSPKHTFSLLADWQIPLTLSLDMQANVTYVYTSSRTDALVSGDVASGFPDVPSSDIVNLSAGLRHDSGVTLSAFANNLLDARNIQFRGLLGTALESATVNRPRTIGLRVGYQF